MQPRVLDLSVTITELGELLRRLLREGVALKIEHGAGLWPVHADEAQLNNAIINLVVNARDAMPNNGAVTIRTGNETLKQLTVVGSASMPAGDYVRVDVADTGIGIPKEYIGKIFDPFFTTKPVGEGTGLGLDISWRIVVNKHHGDLKVESVPGDTRFQVLLPLTATDPDTEPDTVPDPAQEPS